MFRYLLMLCASIHVGFAEDPCEVTHCDHDQTCVVQDGLPVCLSKTRLCSAWGESHYHTLDGRAFDFHGTCNYTFARAPCHVSSNVSGPVEVQIARPPTANATASFDRVLVGVQGFDITMIKGELQQVWVRRGWRHCPFCSLQESRIPANPYCCQPSPSVHLRILKIQLDEV